MNTFRRLLFCLAALAFPACAFGQNFTTVTATVTDPNGIPYAGGSMSAICTPGSSSGYRLNGQPYACQIGNVTLDSTGTFTANFGSNTAITPSGTQWAITVRSNPGGIAPPLGTGGQTFTITITISGATQNISSNLNAVAPKLTNFSGSGGSGITGCSTTGGMIYENGTANTGTCDANFFYAANGALVTLTGAGSGSFTPAGTAALFNFKVTNGATFGSVWTNSNAVGSGGVLSDCHVSINNGGVGSFFCGNTVGDSNGNYAGFSYNTGNIAAYLGTNSAPHQFDIIPTYTGGSNGAEVFRIFDSPCATYSGSVCVTPGPERYGFNTNGIFTDYSDSVHAALLAMIGNTTLPVLTGLTSNYFGWIGPNSGSFTSYFLQAPSTPPSGSQALICGTPSSNVSTCSFGSAGGVAAVPVQLPVAVCQGTGVSVGGSGVAANLPATQCDAGSSTVPQSGLQVYAQASLGSQYVDYAITLPSTWTKINSITWKVLNDTATTGTDYMNFQYVCVADGGTAAPTYAAVQQASGAVPGTINEFVTLTLTNPTISGCAAGNVMYIRIGAGTGAGVFGSGNLDLALAKVEMQ